jgi:4-hydroxybenzoyl-CoA thioesterase
MFEYQWKCSWGNADPHGIAYYPRLVVAMHQAGEEFMESRDISYWNIPEKYGVGLPLVAVDLEFENPVNVGDVIVFSVDPDVGDTSLTFAFEAVHEDGSVAFTGQETHVCVSIDDRETRPLPNELRSNVTPHSE